jgi:hypothetical protein
MSNVIPFPVVTNETRKVIREALIAALKNYPGGSNVFFTMLRKHYPETFWELFVKALYLRSLRDAK